MFTSIPQDIVVKNKKNHQPLHFLLDGRPNGVILNPESRKAREIVTGPIETRLTERAVLAANTEYPPPFHFVKPLFKIFLKASPWSIGVIVARNIPDRESGRALHVLIGVRTP